jgi:hypothetical protein
MGTLDASSVIAGGSLAALQGYQGYKQASAQAEIDKAVKMQNNAEAQRALTQTWSNNQEQRAQIAENAVSASIDAQKLSAQAKGAVKASAGAAGVAGSAVDMQLDDIEVASARNTAKAVMNRERQEKAIASSEMNALHETNNKINLMPVQKPSKWVYGLNAGAQGFRNILAFDGLFKEADKL